MIYLIPDGLICSLDLVSLGTYYLGNLVEGVLVIGSLVTYFHNVDLIEDTIIVDLVINIPVDFVAESIHVTPIVNVGGDSL